MARRRWMQPPFDEAADEQDAWVVQRRPRLAGWVALKCLEIDADRLDPQPGCWYGPSGFDCYSISRPDEAVGLMKEGCLTGQIEPFDSCSPEA